MSRMFMSNSPESFIEKIAGIADAHALHDLAQEVVSEWGLAAMEVLINDGEYSHLAARVGDPISPMTLEREPHVVAENDGVWEFALGAGERPDGWLRVKMSDAPNADVIRNLEQLTRWLSPTVSRLAERERIKLLEHQIELLRDQAQQADRLKEEFLSNLSHELRTPLTAILGFSEILLDRAALPDKHVECVDRIHQNGERLLKLLNRLIQLAKVEADRLQVNLMFSCPVKLVSTCAERHRASAEAKGLQFVVSLDDLPQTYLDPRLFDEALGCVIENAVKFTERGEVRVRAWSDVTRLYVEVRDTGRGIQAAHVPFIFDAFWQGDGSLTRAVGGNGIGLTLANRLIHRLGGEISVSSVPDEGATILLSLPREAPVAKESRRAHEHRHAEQFGLPFKSFFSADRS